MSDFPLFQHQQQAVDFILRAGGSGAIFHEVGLGKTRTILEIYSRLRKRYEKGGERLRLLVLAPIALLDAAWGEDIHKFTDFTYLNLHSDWKKIHSSPSDIFCINYESLRSKEKRKMLHSIMSCVPFMVACDESSRMKNHKSHVVEHVTEIAKPAKYRVIASGTPAPNLETEYWAQMNFVAPGLLPHSFYEFQNKYFYLENPRTGKCFQGQYISFQQLSKMKRQGCKYRMNEKSRSEFMELLKPVCHFAKKRDCLDLPEVVDEIRHIHLGAKQKRAYLDMQRHMIAEIENEQIAVTAALTKIMKLRQLTSGFVLNEQGYPVHTYENPKLTELLQVIEDVGRDKQMIIWCQFTHEIEQIQKALEGESVVVLNGATQDSNGVIRAFKEGQARFLIAHPKSAGHGLTFTNCDTEIFYSLDYSWEMYDQCRGRVHRAGQKRSCTYIHLIAKDTIDSALLKVLQNKDDAQKLLYNMIRGRDAVNS